MSKKIEQTVVFKATSHVVYEALMDSTQHAAFTGQGAVISREVGGDFIAYGGYITGKNVELIPNLKIVQQWRAEDWPEGHYSTVTFLLVPEGDTTRLDFTQVGAPDGEEDNFARGWFENYWNPLKAMLEK